MADNTSLPSRSQRWVTTMNGHRLRHLRHHAGLSQADLGGRAGISLTTIVRLEHSPHASCRPRTLARLAAALGEAPATLSSVEHSGD